MDFGHYIKQQDEKIKRLELIVEEMLNVMDQKDKRIAELEKEIKKLRDLLTKSAGNNTNINSRNSNLPPSKDIAKPKRTKSLRKKSGKKSGGQPGHEGHYLKMHPNPNKTISILPKSCDKCGNQLNQALAVLDASKQEIDIPPIQPVICQYDRYSIHCSCGCKSLGKFPKRLKAKVQYGPRVRSLISYFSVYQYIPYERLQSLLKTCFGISLSQGTINNALVRTAKKAAGPYELIKAFIQQSQTVGSDETVIFVNGTRWYNWVWQNIKATYITSEPNRKKDIIYKHFPSGFPKSVLISDRYSAHLSTPAAGHQACWVHLLRKINYLKEIENNDWLQKLIGIYEKAKRLKQLKPIYLRTEKRVQKLESELNKILLEKIDSKKHKETKSFQKSLSKCRNTLLTFLYYEDVPSHNNDSERAIRNAKVKMKISGFYKSGQQCFAVIRSIIDTLIKNEQPVFENLLKLERGGNIRFGL